MASKFPLKVAFLLWLVSMGKVLMIDNLMVRRMPIPNRCCLCCSNSEMVSHLFLHCLVAHSLCNFFMGWFMRGWVLHASMMVFLEEWCQWGPIKLPGRRKIVWRAILAVVIWTIAGAQSSGIWELRLGFGDASQPSFVVAVCMVVSFKDIFLNSLCIIESLIGIQFLGLSIGLG